MDVDWSKTNQGRKYYNTQSAVDFAAAGISHVRIRIADKVDQELLEGLDRQIRDCLDNGIIPIIAYQADAFKNDPSDKNIEKVVAWWSEVAEHYQDKYLIPSPAYIFSHYNAFLGHALTHSIHRIHSVRFSLLRELSVTSTFIGHTRLHFPQETHLSLSHFTRSRLK